MASPRRRFGVFLAVFALWAGLAAAFPADGGEEEPETEFQSWTPPDAGEPPDAGVEVAPEPVSEPEAEPVEAPRVAVAEPPPPAPPPLNLKCIEEEEYARYRAVKATIDDPHAFRPSALWAPPIFMTDAEHSYAWVALLYFQTLDFQLGTKTRVLAPLFFSHCTRTAETFISPLYSSRTDARGTARLILNYFQRRDRLAESDVVFPFAWSLRERSSESAPWVGSGGIFPIAFWTENLKGEHFKVITPLFWRWGDRAETTTIAANVFFHESREGSDFGLVPLYFRGRSVTSEYDVSPPLFWSFRSEGTHSLFLPPLLTWFQSRPNGFTLTAFPLLFAKREGAEHYTVVPPLFWRWGSKDESTTIVGNVFFHAAPERTDFGIAPLYFFGRSAREDYDISPPLFWSFRSGDTSSLFLPPLLTWFQSRPNGFTLTTFPFLFAKREGDAHHTLIPPVFWRWGDKNQSTTIVGNVFFHEEPARIDFGLAPLYFFGRSATADYDVSPPLFWSFRSGETNSLFLPPLLTWFQSRPTGFTLNTFPVLFVRREGDEHHTVVAPLFWRWGDKTESTTIAGNVFFHEEPSRTDFGIVPLYFFGRSATEAYDVSPPLFWSFRSQGTHSLFLPPLLTWFQSRPSGFTLTAFPFIFARREGDEHHTVVPPLFWRWGNKTENTTIAGNVFFHEEPNRTDFGIVPLYFFGRGATEDYDVSPPLFWSFRSQGTHSLFLPPLLTWFQSRPHGFSLTTFPFIFARREGDEHHTIVPPLFFRWGDKYENTTIAANFFFHEDGARTDVGLVPLFWSYREGEKHSLLIPPLAAFHQGDGQTESTWVLNTYFQSRPSGFTFNAVPLLFAGREGEEHYTFVPPLFWRWGDGKKTTTIAAGFYLHETEGRTYAGFAPFYFRGRTADSQFDVSPFLFWNFHQENRHSLLIPPLLTWYQSRPNGFTLDVVPFLWAGREGAEHHTLVPPLFWQWGDEESETTIAANVFYRESFERTDFGVVPLYFRGRGDRAQYDVSPPLFWSFRDEGKHTLLIPPLLTYFQSRPSGFTLTTLPFLFAGREGARHHTIVAPLFAEWGDAEQQTTIAGNVFLRESFSRSDFGIVPLYFRGRGGPREYDVSPPLFWSFREGETRSLFLPPLLTYFQSRPNGFTLAAVPFLFAGHRGDATHVVVPPLFWHWSNRDESTTVAANVFLHQSEARSDFGVVPLYFQGRGFGGDYDISPPLFWSFRDGDKHKLFIPPLLTWHQSDGVVESTYAFNTWYQTRPNGFTLNVAPFLFAGRQGSAHHTYVPPFFFRWGDDVETTTVVGTAYLYEATTHDDFGFVPFYFGSRGLNGDSDISPLLFWSFRDGEKHKLFLPPLLAYHWGDGQTESTWVLNTWFQSRPRGFSLVSVPLLFAGRERDDFHVIVPPLFWRWGDREKNTTIAANVFFHEEPTRSDFGIVPLYFHGRGTQGDDYDVSPPLFWSFRHGARHTLVLPPLLTASWGDQVESTTLVGPVFHHREPRTTAFGVVPLFYYRDTQRDSGDRRLLLSPVAIYAKTTSIEATVVAGLFFDFKYLPSKTRLTTVFPLYWRWEKPEETTHLFLNLMFSYGQTKLGRSWAFHLFPLIDLVSYHPDHFLWQVLMGLVGREQQADSARWRVAWVWTDPTRGK